MHPAPSRLLLALCLASAPVFAAKNDAPKPAPLDAPPQLISTKGAKPKWKNLSELQQFVAKGDPQACLELANRCLEGDGVPKDMARAIVLLQQAASAGLADAWFRLGKIYHDGLAGETDYGRALEYYTNAARLGITEAQHNLGAMLVSARGVKRDYVEGLAWLIVAAKSGDSSDAEAQVRARLAKRPGDIGAAEARAAEITSDLAHAEVHAQLPGALPPPPAAPKIPPPSLTTPLEKPDVAAPKLEAPKIEVPAPGKP